MESGRIDVLVQLNVMQLEPIACPSLPAAHSLEDRDKVHVQYCPTGEAPCFFECRNRANERNLPRFPGPTVTTDQG